MVWVPAEAEALPPVLGDLEPQAASRLSPTALPAPAPVSLSRSRRDSGEEDEDTDEGRGEVIDTPWGSAEVDAIGSVNPRPPVIHYMRYKVGS
ncbi:hypothetical protein HMPREF9056_00362 [Actinomyces sp. oral taxon 170 str. F0386]|nr:hypothetical protein HMPREF9056_00362 [Actinomyces sp. oral taxon 170 str. F0386]